MDNGREVDRADPMEPDDRDEDAPTDDEDTTTAEDDNDNELVGDEIANEDDDYRRRKSDNAAPKVQSRLQDEPTRDARPAETVDVRVETVAAG